MPFKLQYASNLFVDLTTQSFSKLVKPAAPHLALLGNIGCPESPKTYHFLRYCAKNWDSVLWIPGPHELSNTKGGRMTIHEKTSKALALTRQMKGITLMDSKEMVFHDERVVLLGTPLWTDLSLAHQGEPEFKAIFTSTDERGPIPLTHTARNKLHQQDMFFLMERTVFWSIVHPNVNVVYLSHTVPSSRLYKHKVSERAWNRLYMDCLRIPMGSPLRAWIGGAGALTQTEDIRCEGGGHIQCGVNGLYEYPFTGATNAQFDPQCVLELKPSPPSVDASLSLPNLKLPSFFSSLLPTKAAVLCA